MLRSHLIAVVLCILLLGSTGVFAKLVSTAKDANITTIEIHVRMVAEQKYNVTVTLYELVQYLATKEEKEVAAASGGFATAGTMAIPLKNAPVKLIVGDNVYSTKTTDENGKATFVVDIDSAQLKLDSRGCTEIYARYEGNKLKLASESRREILCKDSALLIAPALTEATKTIKENERLQNACMLFFILIGFLIAGLYASGKDPLRLLDITTPRLPGARKKPEIKVSISDDKFKNLRAAQLKQVNELENEIKTTARMIAKNASYVKNAPPEERKIREEEVYRNIMRDIERIREMRRNDLITQTRNLPVKSAVTVDSKIFEKMNKEIGLLLVQSAYTYIQERDDRTRRKIVEYWGKNGPQWKKIENIARERLIADLYSLAQRGPTHPVMKGLGYTGTISDTRRKIEALPGVGYAVRVADNLRGYVNMAVQYGKYASTYATTGIGYKFAKMREEKARKELESLREKYERESNAFARKYPGLKPLAQYSDFAEIMQEAQRLNITVPITDYYNRVQKLDSINQKIVDKEKEINKLANESLAQWRRFEPSYYTGAQMPDIIKTDKVATMRVSALAKEVLNDINHRLFYELKQNGLMTEDEIDKFNGALQKIPDIADRREEIFKLFKKLKREDLYKQVMSEKLYVEVINYDDKERGFYKNDNESGYYTLQEIADAAQQNIESTNYESSAFVIGAARAIAANPIKFEALIETQEQQLRRYIELDEFVKSDVIDVCVKHGMKKGIEYLMKTEKIEPATRIRETHAKYIGDEVLIELWKGKKIATKHERFKRRLESISEEETSFLIYSEAFKQALSYINKTYAKGKINTSARDINLIRLHYAREMAELEKRRIRDPEERRRREDRIRNTVINSLIDVTGILVNQKEREDIYNTLVASEYTVATPQNIKKITNDEALLEAAVIEWSALMALYRATGITGLTGLKQNIADLANSAEWEQTCRKVLFERAREFNADKKHLLLQLNTELGNIVDPQHAQTMEAEDLLIAIDRVANEVIYKSLMRLFDEVSNESGYEKFYETKTIRGKKHIFVKGFVDPTIEDTPSLIVLYKKELPDRSARLIEIIADELAQRGVQNPQSVAPNYASYHDTISYRYPMLHPGAYPLKDAMNKYGWIQEIGNNYLACPKFLPDYETMGAADKLINVGIAEIETEVVENDKKVNVKRKVLLPVKDTFARKAAQFLNIQANMFVNPSYIGTMAEAAATTVIYTRHGAFIKKLISPYQGKEGFVKEVIDNEAVAEKLLDVYKLRYLYEKIKKLDNEEIELIMKELDPERLRNSLLDELELVKAKMEHENVPNAAGKSISEVNALINSRILDLQNTTDLRKVDEINKDINELRKYREILESIETIRNISFSVTRTDFERDPQQAIQNLKSNIDAEKANLDEIIKRTKPHVGEYVMQELLNDLLVKGKRHKKENEEELSYIRKEIEFVDRIASDSLHKEIADTLSQIRFDKNEYALLDPYLTQPSSTADRVELDFDEIMKRLNMIYNNVRNNVDQLDDAIKIENNLRNQYSKDIADLISTKASWKNDLDVLRNNLITIASPILTQNRATRIVDEAIALGEAEKACNQVIHELETVKQRLSARGRNVQNIQQAVDNIQNNLLIKAQTLDTTHKNIVSKSKTIANKIANEREISNALPILSNSPDPTARNVQTILNTVRDGTDVSNAINSLFTAIKNEKSRLSQKASLIEQQQEELRIKTEEKIRAMAERRRTLARRKESVEANIHIYSEITPWSFWRLATYIRYSSAVLVRIWRYMKEKFTQQQVDRETRRRSYFSNGSLVQEVFEYSKLIRERKEEMTEFEKLMAQHARNHAYLAERFLVKAFGLYASFEAGMHTRKKMYGLNISAEAGHQFAGPLPSTMMQQIATYGRFGNAGWFTSLLLAYSVSKAHQIYARRYPLLKLISGLPAVYDPMKSNTHTFRGTVKGMMTAMLYMRYKHKYARLGEVIRSTAKDSAPRAFFPYLVTSNPYGEMRMTEILELASDGFRTTPRGPRDMLNYMLYKPNDIIVDFQDLIFSLKDGRSMKKTPEHLMDVGIYGVVGNCGFIAGREINFINTALGGPESMYSNRAFNMFNYNPQLSIPQMRYAAYGDMYKRTTKPIDIAEEMIHYTELSHRVAVEALIVPPLILAATYFGGYLGNMMWNSYTLRSISNTGGSALALLFGMSSIGAIGMIYRYEKLNSLKHIANIPYMSDEWKTYIRFSERMRNLHMGTYRSEVFYHE